MSFKPLKIIFYLLGLSLIGCSNTFSSNKVLSDCYPSYKVEIPDFLKSDDDFFTLWYLSGDGKNDGYLKSKKIIGHITRGRVTGYPDRINKDSNGELLFTGAIYKSSPNWAEYNIVGGRKHVSPIVEFQGNKYIWLEEDSEQWKDELNEKCN